MADPFTIETVHPVQVERTVDGKYVYYEKTAGGNVRHESDFFDIAVFKNPTDAMTYSVVNRDPRNQHKIYHVDGVTNPDGSLRDLSIGQLVMILCLARASEAEAIVVDLMEQMTKNTALIQATTMIQEKLAAKNDGISKVADYLSSETRPDPPTNPTAQIPGLGMTSAEIDAFQKYCKQAGMTNALNYWDLFYKDKLGLPLREGVEIHAVYVPADIDFMITQIGNKLDSLNSISQELLIELQNQTTKRDQAYDLLSAMLKSMNSTMMGNANNM